MTYFHTCRACVIDGACEVQNELKSAIAGLGIRSLKHHCTQRVDMFKPGAPVLVDTWATYDRGEDDSEPPVRDWFKGHFIQYARDGRPLVYVAAGTPGEGGEGDFEPHGNGFLKVALSRVKSRDGEPVDTEACRWCAAILGVGQNCARDPHYTPASQCLFNTRSAGAGPLQRPAHLAEGQARSTGRQDQ